MASLLRKVGLNSLGFLAGKAAAALAGILLLRVLKPELAGLYGAALGYAALAQTLAELGLATALAGSVAADPANASAWWSQGLLVQGLQTAAVAGLLAVFLVMGGSGIVPASLVALAYAVIALSSMGTICAAVLQGMDRFGVQGLLTTAASLMNAAALGALLLWGRPGPRAALLVLLASGALGAGLWLAVTRAQGLRWVRPSRASLAGLWRRSLPFAMVSVTNLLYLRVDQVLLAWMVGAGPLGLYVAAVKVVDLLVPTLGALYNPLFVHLKAQLAGGGAGRQQAGRSLGRAMRYMAAVCLPLGVGGSLLAPGLVGLLYGPDFAGAAPALALLVWVAALIGIHSSLLHALNAAGRTSVLAYMNTVNLGLNVALNLWAVPHWGILASAALSVLGELLNLGVAWWWCRREGLAPNAGPLLWPALPAALVMGAALLLTQAWAPLGVGLLPLAGRVLMGAAIYAAALAALGFIGEDERGLWRRVAGAWKG